MLEYEKERMERIKENKARMEAAGLTRTPSLFMGLIQKTKKASMPTRKSRLIDEDEEYNPLEGEDQFNSSSEDDFEEDLAGMEYGRSRKNQITRRPKKARCPAGSMTSIMHPPSLPTTNPSVFSPQQPPIAINQPQLHPNQQQHSPLEGEDQFDSSGEDDFEEDLVGGGYGRFQKSQITKRRKRARCPAGSMTSIMHPPPLPTDNPPLFSPQQPPIAINQPQLYPNQQHQSITDQHQTHNQPINNNITPTLSNSQQSSQGLHASSGSDSNSGQATTKAKRGPARPFTGWGTGQIMQVELNELNQPVGENGAKLQSQLGIIARNGIFAPLIFTDWRAEGLAQFKERIWEEVKANTNVPEIYKRNCLKSVGRKWKDWKEKLKRDFYDKYNSDEDRLANCPDRVDPDQWRILVQFWGSKEAKERSITNKSNRGEQTMCHTTGRKAHCRLKDEIYKKTGKNPDRIDMYILTHTKKDKNPVDKTSAEAMSRINDLLSQVPESSQSATFREEVFTKVLGPDNHGRIRTYGLGPCPSEVFGTKYTRYRDQHEMERLRSQVRQEIMAEMEDRFARLESMEHKCAKFLAHMESLGYLMPQSPVGDAPSIPSRIVQNGSGSSCNMQQLPEASNSHHQLNEDVLVSSHDQIHTI